MKVERIYSKRPTERSDWDGRVGHVTLEAPNGKWKLDGQELPERSVEYLMMFALQSLQDAYAGAKSLTEAEASWTKKRDAILDGTIGVRTGGGGEPAHMRFVRTILRTAMKNGSKALPDDAAKQYENAEDRNALLAEWFDALPEATQAKVETHAKELLEQELEKQRAAKAAAESVGL